MKYLYLLILPVLLLATPVYPSWGTCGEAGQPQAQQDYYLWIKAGDTQQALMCNGQQVGNWSGGRFYEVGTWREIPLPQGVELPQGPHYGCVCTNCQCGKDCKCSNNKGCQCQTCKEKTPEVLTGVIPEKRGVPCTTVNGECVPSTKAYEALVSGLPDDSGKCHITVICGDKTIRDGIVAFIKADPNSQKFQVQDIDPTAVKESWMLECGFKKPSTPQGVVVYAQAPGGKVLWREDSWNPQHITLGLRKTDPAYDPNKDPDLNPKAAPAPVVIEPVLKTGHWIAIAGIAVTALVFFKKKG